MNIFKEKKVHIAKGGYNTPPLCGASGNEQPLTIVAHRETPPGVTCLRCIKKFGLIKEGKTLARKILLSGQNLGTLTPDEVNKTKAFMLS